MERNQASIFENHIDAKVSDIIDKYRHRLTDPIMVLRPKLSKENFVHSVMQMFHMHVYDQVL